jgi:hypothetical protein
MCFLSYLELTKFLSAYFPPVSLPANCIVAFLCQELSRFPPFFLEIPKPKLPDSLITIPIVRFARKFRRQKIVLPHPVQNNFRR